MGLFYRMLVFFPLSIPVLYAVLIMVRIYTSSLRDYSRSQCKFPYFEKNKKAYKMTLLSCVPVCPSYTRKPGFVMFI
jgi:hypothetical protein